MSLRIETNNINIEYQYNKNRNSNTNPCFSNKLEDSIEFNKNQYKAISIYSKQGTIKNINNNISPNYSKEEIEKRRSEIHELQKEYDNGIYDPNLCMPKVNTKTMEKILDLEIKNNKQNYYDNSGEININKIAEKCGISLNNATPIELQSLRSELKHEGLIDDGIDYNFDIFINRAFLDNFLNGNSSRYDIYNSKKFDVFQKANSFMKTDYQYNDLINYNIDNNLLNFFS
ncbi:hypothetical protein [Clostridium saccharobutylicum]|uniref:Uncharacterized protein n=1 Tax=Clostridium saccharobutylicum TaxID=169679 RepID=A0A1S8NCQ3_CLOSA|nr:hypothetical protein [Clostridium saccharobutylicum]OOM14210.1 hypothetical protein CLOSAC_10830 [Clostridium saccharobutylicum]